MKNRIFALLALAALLLSLLAACGDKGFIDTAKAEKIVLKDLGISASQAQIHTHGGNDSDGTPIYSIHVTVDGVSYEYIVRASDGEILSSGLGGH